MGGHEARDYWEHVGLVMLMAGFFAGPAAWFLDLQISYAMVKWTCEHDLRWSLLPISLGSLLLVAGGSALSWTSFVKLRGEAAEDGARIVDRSYFLALGGLALNAIFGLLILTSLAPRLLLSPCE